MHVGVFSYYYLPIINGVTITIADWKRLGEIAGHQFTIFIPHLRTSKKIDADVVMYPALSVYQKMGITASLFPELFIDKEIRSRKLDILHVHHPFHIGKLALFAKKKLGTPLIFTYHTRYADYARSYVPFLPKLIVRYVVTHLMRRFMNQCSAITVANESLKLEVIRSGVTVPVYIVPPGIDTHAFVSGNRSATRKRLGLRASDVVLLYVGRLAKEKNIYFLLQAFTRIAKINPRITLLLCGNGLEVERIRSFTKRKHLDSRVVLTLHETPKTIRDIYAAADVFVYASQTETYGRVIVEAMAAGLPVVALRGPSLVDLLQDHINGRIVWRKSSKAFAAIVSELVADQSQMKRLGQSAQKEAQARYDSVVSWRELSNIYSAVVAANKHT